MPKNDMTRNYCTLFDINYLTRGMALYDSLIVHADDFHLWILCMDAETYDILKKMNLKKATLIKLIDFEDKELLKVKSSRTQGEYCWTCTPSLPLYIFKKWPQVEMISYLDSDLYFYSSPEPIFTEFGNNSIMIIPHRFSGDIKTRENKSGIYNVGMMTFRQDKNAISCLKWWREKCLDWCFYRIEGNKLGDQKYLEQFEKLFKGVHILKHIGAGLGPWNIRQYRVWSKNGKIFIDHSPLIFYHFVGLKIYCPIPFLLPAPLKGYGEINENRTLIYEPYFLELYKQLKIAQQDISSFKLGFEPRPNVIVFLKEEIVANIIYLRKYIN